MDCELEDWRSHATAFEVGLTLRIGGWGGGGGSG